MKVTLTHYTPSPLNAIEEAACNCYDSKPCGGKIAKSCIKSGHLAVTEFADFTFHIEGVSRALTHQLVRHRLASYAQRSQRYCVENQFEYVIPETIKKDKAALAEYEYFMRTCQNIYQHLVDIKIPPEDARYILPNACSSVIEVKMNFRNLMHFFNERLCCRSQWEIRQMANLMKQEVIRVCPELAEYCVPKCEVNKDFPFCTETKSCGRHKRLEEIYKKEQD